VGAPGCSVLTSSDIFLLANNFSGTAYMNLALPPGITPSTTPAFFVQSFTLDFAANPLGLVLSNAGAVTVGIR
jgi:hypothetical protein